MKYTSIAFEEIEGLEHDVIRCPICHAVWYENIDGEACFVKPCQHLKFIWDQDGAPEVYNGFNLKELTQAAQASYAIVHGQELSEPSDRDILFQLFGDEDLWAELTVKGVDELLDHTQHYMACGPASHTVLFGIKH